MVSKENQECVGLASRLRQNQGEKTEDNSPHLIVVARAGTGKTTTLVEGLKRMKGLPVSIEPSPQQAAIWEAMEQSKDARSTCFVAFNKAIATELQQRVPKGCDAMTMHSMGFKAVREAFGRVRVNSYRVQDIVSELLETDIRELRRYKPDVLKATEKLVGLCKMNLVSCWGKSGFIAHEVGMDELSPLGQLASHYDVDLNGNGPEVFALVPRVLDRCKQVGQGGSVDFADMIWLPVVLGLNVYRYDLLLVDEAQDLNRCQQALALKAGRRLILCGDPKQAIYGFAGADSESMTRMEGLLTCCNYCGCEYGWKGGLSCPQCNMSKQSGRGCVTLPLTVTRRCDKAIVTEAQKYVPDFEAHESCGAGRVFEAAYQGIYANMDEVYRAFKESSEWEDNITGNEWARNRGYSYHWILNDGDMVLCRVNAPLVSECFKFLKAGRKANIQGRDVGQGLISTIRRLMKRRDHPISGMPGQEFRAGVINEVACLLHRLNDWLYTEQRKEDAKRNPSDARLIALQDRYDCLTCFCEEQRTVEGVVKKIETVFTDEEGNTGIRLSSIHKAKGMEATRVFLLQPEGASIPHPMAKTSQQREQEMNLLYVAITRAKEELIYVS